MKITNFFPHDSNARNDEKLLKIRMALGAEGYGIYFMILERLRDETDYMSVKDYNMIAFDLRVNASAVKKIVEDFGLFVFTDDGEYFYSESFIRRMEIKDNIKQARSEAGKKGALSRWEKGENTGDNGKAIANAWQTHGKAIANAWQMPSKSMASKQSKESKESKQSKQSKAKQTYSAPAGARGVLESFCGDDLQLYEAFNAYLAMRQANKFKMTEQAMKLAITELKKLTDDRDTMIAIIEQSTLKGWKSFYALPADKAYSRNNFDDVDNWARGVD